MSIPSKVRVKVRVRLMMMMSTTRLTNKERESSVLMVKVSNQTKLPNSSSETWSSVFSCFNGPAAGRNSSEKSSCSHQDLQYDVNKNKQEPQTNPAQEIQRPLLASMWNSFRSSGLS